MTSTLSDLFEAEMFESVLAPKVDLRGWILDDYLEEIQGRLQTSAEG